MLRLTTATVALATTLVLSGCLPAPGAGGPTAAPETPSASPSAPEPTPAPGPISLPGCAELYTADQVALLIGADLELIGDATHPESDGGYGTSFPALATELRDGDSVNCTWILPASERGLTVSFMVVTSAQRDAVTAVLTSAGIAATPVGGDFSIYAFADDGEYPFTEAHGLGGELWVCAQDGFGVNAPALVQAALDTIIELNPGRF